MQSVSLGHPEVCQTRSDAEHDLFVLHEAHEIVTAHLVVRPLLFDLLLLSIDHLLDFLVLMVSFDELPGAQGFGVAEFISATLEDVEDGPDIS